MSNTSSYIQVPPQSSGKKVATNFITEIFFDNRTDYMAKGSVIVGETTNAQGTISSIDNDGFTPTEGRLFLTNVTGQFQDNENISINGVTVATINFSGTKEQSSLDIQKVLITDPFNLQHNQRVDRFGASLTTFTDGSPLFGPFGTLMTGEPISLRDYTFPYNDDNMDYYDREVGGGEVSWDRQRVSSLLTTGTASGDVASRTTNYYHEYTPGVGTLVEFTAQIGDSGKNNVVRRWGYFDDDNGLFFELNGTDLFVVLRSNTSGSVVETRYPQAQWNQDSLDGTNSINFELDVTKGNIYWIDLQWLGAGRVRFGVIEPGGSRLLAHVIENANTNSVYPYMRTATLPLRWEQENIGAAVSSSEMRVACAVVKATSPALKVGDKRTTDTGVINITSADGEVVIGAIRPKLQYMGEKNRAKMRVRDLNVINLGGDGVLQIRSHVTLSPALEAVGANFTSIGDSSAFEKAMGKIPHIPAFSTETVSFIAVPNQAIHQQEISNELDPKIELCLSADNVTQPCYFITAKLLNGTNADVYLSLNWEESKR